jgi:hypothetical protein
VASRVDEPGGEDEHKRNDKQPSMGKRYWNIYGSALGLKLRISKDAHFMLLILLEKISLL